MAVEARPPDSLGSTALVRVAAFTLAAFEARKIPLPTGNRLVQAVELIRDSHERRIDLADPAAAARIAAAIRDVWDFCVIVHALPSTRDADREGKVRVMLRGRVGAEKGSTKPRDFQFELLVGAIIAQGEIHTWSAEPDLRVELDGQTLGIPVKRVQSGTRLAPNITAARAQLERQHLRGVIVVDVDAFLDGVPPCAAPAEAGPRILASMERLRRLLPDLATHPSLLGLVAMGRIVGWDFAGTMPRLCNHWFNYPSSFVDPGATEGVGDELARRLRIADERMRALLLRAAAETQEDERRGMAAARARSGVGSRSTARLFLRHRGAGMRRAAPASQGLSRARACTRPEPCP